MQGKFSGARGEKRRALVLSHMNLRSQTSAPWTAAFYRAFYRGSIYTSADAANECRATHGASPECCVRTVQAAPKCSVLADLRELTAHLHACF